MVRTFLETLSHENSQLECEDFWPEGWDIKRQSWKIGPKEEIFRQNYTNFRFYDNQSLWEIQLFAQNNFSPVLEFWPVDNLSIPLDATNRFPVLSEWVTLSEWGTCTPFSMRFLAIYWLEKSFLSKVKGMDDRGIILTFHRCAQVFEFFSANTHLSEWGTCLNWVHSARGFWLFTV